MAIFGTIIIGAIVAWIASVVAKERRETAGMTPAEREKRADFALASFKYGNLNSAMICPHCAAKGSVHTQTVDRKRGVSGGKATAALLTGGVSMLATGLSRKERVTQARCTACSNSWDF